MNIVHATSFTRNALRLCAGPLIWAAHFLGIYGLTGVVCARPDAQVAWLGSSILVWGVGAASVAALVAIAALQWRAGRQQASDDSGFIRWTAAALSVLSSIAIVWETMPVFLVSACG